MTGTVQDSPPVAALNTSGHNNALSYAYALKYICKDDNWSLQKAKSKIIAEKSNSHSIRKKNNNI